MPLNEGAINQILPFCTDGSEAAGDLMSLEAYAAHTSRTRGHQKGLGLRELENRALRQISHVSAGLAQFIANRHAAGVLDDGDLDALETGFFEVIKGIVLANAPAPDLSGFAPANHNHEIAAVAGLASALLAQETLIGAKAPKPTSDEGVGQFVKSTGATLPAGGTWAFIGFCSDSAAGVWAPAQSNFMKVGIEAGGTTTTGWSASSRVGMLCWRLA